MFSSGDEIFKHFDGWLCSIHIYLLHNLAYVGRFQKPLTDTSILLRASGTKKSETTYVNDKMHGTQIWYNEDGSKKEERLYENGEEISEKEWDEDGNLIKEETY